MKFENFEYDVKVSVLFSELELDFLIERAKRHYDHTCKAAGLMIDDGARENGFIAQAKHFHAGRAVTWTSRQIDTTLKILEPITNKDAESAQRIRLFIALQDVWYKIQTRHEELLHD